jgi:hypothetical protein
MTGVFWQRLFDVPWIATQAPALLEAQPMGGGVLAFGLRLSIIVMAAGWMLFGISSFRAGVYPRIPAVLLIIGAPLLIPGVPGAALPFTVAVVWLGYALFTRQGTAVSVDSAAAPRMVPAS